MAVLERGAPATGALDGAERRGNAPPKATGEGVGVGAEVAKRGWGVTARPVTTGGLETGVGRRSGTADDDAVDDEDDTEPAIAPCAGLTVRPRPTTAAGDDGPGDGDGVGVGVGAVTLRPITTGGDDGTEGLGANDGNVAAEVDDAGAGVGKRAGAMTLCPMRTGGRSSTGMTAGGNDDAGEAPSISGWVFARTT